MKMAIDFALHPHIRPICLPMNDENTYSDHTATVSGWGALVYKKYSPPYSNTLKGVDVNIKSNTECGGEKYGYRPERITEQMLCANTEGGGKDACQGDSGKYFVDTLLFVI